MARLVPSSSEKRNAPRYSVNLRVDLRALNSLEKQDILDGAGYQDLTYEALSMARPRGNLQSTELNDLSASGLRIIVPDGSLGLEGESLAVDMHLPGDRRVVKLLGDVIWTQVQAGMTVAGIRIAALERDGSSRLNGFLEAIEPMKT